MQFQFFSEKSLLIRKNKDLLSFIQKENKNTFSHEEKEKRKEKERKAEKRQTDRQTASKRECERDRG